MQRYAIDTCAMLVEFSASVWTARKLDRKVSDEVVASKSAGSKAAARVNKNLLAGRDELDVIQAHVTSVRNYVYDNTLPWSDSGLRLLPTIRFTEFNARMQEEENKTGTCVNPLSACILVSSLRKRWRWGICSSVRNTPPLTPLRTGSGST